MKPPCWPKQIVHNPWRSTIFFNFPRIIFKNPFKLPFWQIPSPDSNPFFFQKKTSKTPGWAEVAPKGRVRGQEKRGRDDAQLGSRSMGKNHQKPICLGSIGGISSWGPGILHGWWVGLHRFTTFYRFSSKLDPDSMELQFLHAEIWRWNMVEHGGTWWNIDRLFLKMNDFTSIKYSLKYVFKGELLPPVHRETWCKWVICLNSWNMRIYI